MNSEKKKKYVWNDKNIISKNPFYLFNKKEVKLPNFKLLPSIDLVKISSYSNFRTLIF